MFAARNSGRRFESLTNRDSPRREIHLDESVPLGGCNDP
jgi:hypothetical protein